MQNRFSAAAERLRETIRHRLQKLRVAYTADLDEGTAALEPVPQPRMPNKNQKEQAVLKTEPMTPEHTSIDEVPAA